MATHNETEQHIDEEDYLIPLDIPVDYRDIGAVERKNTIRELWGRYTSGALILEPDFQRHYVWDPIKASRYIESLLLKLPTPPIFLSQEKDDTWIVIDGHQRLETIFRFMQPLLKGPSIYSGVPVPWRSLSPLSLKCLEVMTDLNSKGVVALLEEDRERLWDTELSIIEIPNTAHHTMKYVLFARLNQGSMSLNSQELRNCLYRGPYNQLIAQLSEDRRLLELWGKNTPDRRMKDRELVLRFFAFLHRLDKYKPPLRGFLSEEMKANMDGFTAEKAKHYRLQFQTALSWVEMIFGNEAFRQFKTGNENNPVGRWTPRRYDLIYEVEMAGFAQFGDALN